MFKKLHRTLWMPIALAIYLTGAYIYLYLNGQMPMTLRTGGLIVLSYALVVLLFYLRLRRLRRLRALEESVQQMQEKNAQAKAQEQTDKPS